MAVFQLAVRQVLFDQRMLNIHYIEGDTLSYGDGQTIAEIFASNAQAELAAFRTADYAWLNADWRQVDQPGFPSVRETPPSTHNGSNVGQNLPYQACLLVSLSAPSLKPNKARKYLGGFNETATANNNLWEAGLRTAAEAWMAGIINDLETTGGWDYVTARWDPTNTFVESWNELTSWQAQFQIFTQRRRVPDF